MMDALISRITASVGIPAPLAEKAVGMILGYMQRAGDDGPVARMMTQIPGATEMIAQYGGAETEGAEGGGSGGIMGSVMGAISSLTGGDSSGGAMAIGQTLMAEGLEMGQIKQVAEETIAYAKETAGEDTVNEVVNSVPGLSAIL